MIQTIATHGQSADNEEQEEEAEHYVNGAIADRAEQRAQTPEQSESAEQVRAFTFIAASEASHVPELRDVRSGVSRS